MSKLKEYLAINIKKYKKEKNMTQSDLADSCNTSTNYIAIIETCKRFPREDMLERIAEAFEIEPFKLFIKPNTVYIPEDSKKNKFIAKLINFVKNELE